jgi:hypothetical protein
MATTRGAPIVPIMRRVITVSLATGYYGRPSYGYYSQPGYGYYGGPRVGVGPFSFGW